MFNRPPNVLGPYVRETNTSAADKIQKRVVIRQRAVPLCNAWSYIRIRDFSVFRLSDEKLVNNEEIKFILTKHIEIPMC